MGPITLDLKDLNENNGHHIAMCNPYIRYASTVPFSLRHSSAKQQTKSSWFQCMIAQNTVP